MTPTDAVELFAQTQAEDGRLLERMARRDPAALESLFDRYSGVLHGLAAGMLHDPSSAADVVHAAFLHAWREGARFDPARGQVLGWLISLVRKAAIERQRVAGAAAGPASAGAATSDEAPAGAPAWVQELRRATLRALDTLPEVQRAPLALAYFGGLTHGEIAERLETPPDGVRTRVRQGMARLRDLLGGFVAAVAPGAGAVAQEGEDPHLELAPDYALGLLEDEPLAEFEKHLASGCAACAGEVEAMDAVGDALAVAAPVVPPPDDLRGRVTGEVAADLKEELARAEHDAMRDAIAGTPVDRRAAGGAEPGAPLRPGQPAMVPTYAPAPAPWPPRREAAAPPPPRRGAFERALPALALVLLVGAGAAGYQVFRLQGRVAALQDDLERINGIRQQMARVLDVVAAPGLALVELPGQAVAPDARGRLLWSPGERKAVLHAFALPAPPAGRDYQLWVIDDGAPRSEGVFPVDAQGRAVHVLPEVPDPAAVQAFVVTLEPAGGAPQPTGDAYLMGAVPQRPR